MFELFDKNVFRKTFLKYIILKKYHYVLFIGINSVRLRIPLLLL